MRGSIEDWINANKRDIKILAKSDANYHLKNAGLPYLNTIVLKNTDLKENRSLERYIRENSPIIALANRNGSNQKQVGAFDINSMSGLNSFVRGTNFKSDYFITLIPQIKGTPDGLIGSAISDGENVYVEMIVKPFITDHRIISRGKSSDSVKAAHFLGKIMRSTHEEYRQDFFSVRNYCVRMPGYYEFVKGEIKDKERIWFVDYQNDNQFIDLFI